MGKSYGPQSAPSALIPVSGIYDTSVIRELDVESPEFRIFLVRLQNDINTIASAVNIRDAGVYNQTEFINGQLFFPNPILTATSSTTPVNRPVFRKVINFGALPNTATKTAAHGLLITAGYTFTRIYGTASNTAGSLYLPIPYASATAANIIELSVDGTNVSVTTGKDMTAYTVCYIVLEYIKQ